MMKRRKVRLFILTSIEHQEFLKKRKDHYKNELKAAQLLRAHVEDEDEDQ
jgi:hypothetical protein